MHNAVIKTPLGPVWAEFAADALLQLRFVDEAAQQPTTTSSPIEANQVPPWLAKPLTAYFAGDLNALDAIPINPRGTKFQHRVWDAVRAVSAGLRTSYGAIAATLGQPRSSQAVGGANRNNPILLVIPCHRIVASNGELRGYVAGLHRKQWLLHHEAAAQPLPLAQWAHRNSENLTNSNI